MVYVVALNRAHSCFNNYLRVYVVREHIRVARRAIIFLFVLTRTVSCQYINFVAFIFATNLQKTSNIYGWRKLKQMSCFIALSKVRYTIKCLYFNNIKYFNCIIFQ